MQVSPAKHERESARYQIIRTINIYLFGAMNYMTNFSLKTLSVSLVGMTSISLGTIIATPSHAVTLTQVSTFGSDMVGMQVTANFKGGGSQTLTWGATGSDSGGVFGTGTGWSLTETGDTFTSPWTFNNTGTAITSLIINAIPANTLFDTSPSPNGHEFTVASGLAPDSVVYSAPINDIKISPDEVLSYPEYGTLSLFYNNGFTGALTFVADTDRATVYDPVVQPTPTPIPSSTKVPEPSTAGTLLLAGLAILFCGTKQLTPNFNSGDDARVNTTD